MRIAVLGGGPGGYSAAFEAARLGAQVTLVERERLGGTCLNWGCIPTKTILRSAHIVTDTAEAAEFGLNASVGDGRHRPGCARARTASSTSSSARSRRAPGASRSTSSTASGRLVGAESHRSTSPRAARRSSRATPSSWRPARSSSSSRTSTTTCPVSGPATTPSRSPRSRARSSSSAAASSGWSSRAPTRPSAAR